MIAYCNSFNCPFIFDDHESIGRNIYTRHLWPLTQAMKAPPQSSVAGRPIVSLSLAVNYAINSASPWSYHVLNLAIHLCTGLLLFGIIRRTLLAPRLAERFGQASTGLALTAAVLWLVHPLQTESITYIIQRAESLAGLFYLLTLYCSIRAFFAASPLVWYVFAVVASAFGMATKEVMVTAPLVVLLYNLIFVSPSLGATLRRRGPFYIALASTWLLLLAINLEGPRSGSAGFRIESSTPLTYAATQFGVILHYLRLSIWPYRQCLDYAWPLASTPWPIIGPAIAIAALLAGMVWALFRNPPLGFLGAFFFLYLSPTSSIIPINDRAFEHRFYVPLAAVVVLLVLAGHRLLQWKYGVMRDGRSRARIVALVLPMAIILVLTVLTLRRNHDYRTETAIWSDVIEQRPDNPRAYDSLATAYTKAGQVDDAIKLFEKMLARWPDHSDGHHNFGAALAQKGDAQRAEKHFRETLRLDPYHAQAHHNLGLLLYQKDKLDEALFEFGEALRLYPEYPEAHNSAGRLFVKVGRLDDAIDQYQQALSWRPDWPRVQNNLGNVLTKRGRLEEATVHFRRAMQLQPDRAEFHSNLGIALAQQGRWDEAIAEFRAAIRLKPGAAAPYYNLAGALAKQGKIDEALEQCREAARRRPKDAEPFVQMGQLLAQSGRTSEAADQYRAALRIDPNHRVAKNHLAELTTTKPAASPRP